MLKGKKIIVAVSGGIAAYKSPLLVRLLIKSGCEVKVIATKNALQFTTETTLRSVSKNPVYKDMFSRHNSNEVEHISIADWADMLVIAPATANIIGKYANGIADDVLSTTLLAFNKKVFIVPAMNTNMYNNPAVQENMAKLQQRNIEIISPISGELACGCVGEGKMAEPQEIFDRIKTFFEENTLLIKDKVVLVTAGATYEKIDAVRFIGNYSSGKMGFALAQRLADSGAKVKLIAANTTAVLVPNPNIEVITTKTAEEMYVASMEVFPLCDAAILAAAVADYTPTQVADNKIKKSNQSLTIELKPTKDILASLGKIKTNKQVLTGFALETENEIENAKKKLKQKNLDFIVLNSLNDKGAGFSHDTNKITIIDKSGEIITFPLKTKKEVAADIVQHLISTL
ncbi:MAG: bifunctional phosphopantothenoylcysteine decarboxylase/phosphopantothenate--cysteine ligase CoaBC [Bacteroidales bacterium]|jgi:phosphopantothenoylcysteine decarboxylase/phosphopantothenate--cysteine ligase|nr:bifunctional phosphopantothenoylcysteine decarboxylase/phosphopantothenate--cysteine ligase CoaBC [Bacteroidales bacterium]